MCLCLNIASKKTADCGLSIPWELLSAMTPYPRLSSSPLSCTLDIPNVASSSSIEYMPKSTVPRMNCSSCRSFLRSCNLYEEKDMLCPNKRTVSSHHQTKAGRGVFLTITLISWSQYRMVEKGTPPWSSKYFWQKAVATLLEFWNKQVESLIKNKGHTSSNPGDHPQY